MSHLWFGYAWPSLEGNGPEDLISFIVLGTLTAILWPRIKRAWRGHRGAVERNFIALQHIAKHSPDIPEIGHDGHTKKAAPK